MPPPSIWEQVARELERRDRQPPEVPTFGPRHFTEDRLPASSRWGWRHHFAHKDQCHASPTAPPHALHHGACPRDIVAGGRAAREVYLTPELRARVFGYIDSKATLAGMLRLEKAATASVAAELYREIHVSLVSKMSRRDGVSSCTVSL